MSYSATVIADSTNYMNNRVLTIELVFPRFILPEVNTHRSLSKSASSSRALSVKKRIAEVKDNPFIPEAWGTTSKKMQAGPPLVGWKAKRAEFWWLLGAKSAVFVANRLLKNNVHKEIANRVLEPYLWQTVVATGNIEYFNHLLKLRNHKDAQPQFKLLAEEMQEAITASSPTYLSPGEWHLPYVLASEKGDIETAKRLSAARCARTSYGNPTGKSQRDDLQLADFLYNAPHLAPFEMQLTPLTPKESEGKVLGNITGWRQYRHDIEDTSYYPGTRSGRKANH